MRDRYLLPLLLLFGIVAALLKILYSFFPLSFAMEVLVFALLGAGVGAWSPGKIWLRVAPLTLPALVLCGLVLRNARLENLGEGVGVGWVYSIVLIPASTALGMFVARRLRGGGPKVAPSI